MFRTAYDPKVRFHSCPGQTHVPDYVLSYHDNGVQYLKKIGDKNIYKMIQAHQENCDLKMITSQLDPKLVANQMSSFRVDDIDNTLIQDLTSCPTSLGEALNVVKTAEHMFNGLPNDVRKEFNFSTSAFIKSVGTDKFNSIFGKVGASNDGILQVPLPGHNIIDSVPGGIIQTPEQIINTPAPNTKKKKKKVIEVEVDDDDE